MDTRKGAIVGSKDGSAAELASPTSSARKISNDSLNSSDRSLRKTAAVKESHDDFQDGSQSVADTSFPEGQAPTAPVIDQGNRTRNSDTRSNQDSHSTKFTPRNDSQLSRTSLENLQQWPASQIWSRLADPGASQISLPSSRVSEGTSTVPPENASPTIGSSLQDLLLRPEQVPLPEDGDQGVPPSASPNATNTSQKPANKPGWTKRKTTTGAQPTSSARRTVAGDVDIYRDNVNRLAQNFPSFSDVATGTTRHAWSCRIVLHDKFEGARDGETRRQEPWAIAQTSPPPYEEFYRVVRNVSDDCRQRIIFVEDLNPILIGLLGAAFQIPPHVFQEHLERSGYQIALDNQDHEKMWQTRSSAQGYASVTWYRPVLPLVPMNAKLRGRLLMNTKPAIRCVFEGCKERHNVRLATTANIWRRNLELCPEPGMYHKGSKTEFPVGWEERATIFARDIDGCKFVILLLDPLPVTIAVNDQLKIPPESWDLPQQRVPVLASLLLPPQALLEVTTALEGKPQDAGQAQFVRDWTNVPRPPDLESQNQSAPARSSYASEVSRSAAMPNSPEAIRKASISIPQKLTAKNLARATGAVSNLPGTMGQEFSPAALRRRATKLDMDDENLSESKKAHHTTFKDYAYPSKKPGEPADPDRQRTQEATRRTLSHEPFVPYNPIKARPSASAKVGEDFTASDVHEYIKSLQVPTSTLDEFEYFLQMPGKGKEAAVYDPFRALLRVIHDDTQSLVDIVRVSCQRIREGTMDEDLMQKRVSFWRNLTRQLNFTLADVDQQLRAFVNFTYDADNAILAYDRRTGIPSERLARDTGSTLRNCIDLLDRSASSLLSEMQIVDSRRSIAEAESVSKLTELAFVFIPLSFVASLFSMQINELEGGTSAYVFVLVALGFVLAAYAVRLSIRSSRIAKYKHQVLNQVRDDSHIPYNQPIPTHTFVIWAGGAVGGSLFKSTQSFVYMSTPIILIAATIAAILSPIIVLWLRGMNKGFTAMITVLMLVLDMVLIYPVVVNAAGALEFNPRKIIREITETYEYNKKLKEKMKRKQRKEAENPDAIDIESSDGDFELVEKPRSSASSRTST